jgi:hypothetical protein
LSAVSKERLSLEKKEHVMETQLKSKAQEEEELSVFYQILIFLFGLLVLSGMGGFFWLTFQWTHTQSVNSEHFERAKECANLAKNLDISRLEFCKEFTGAVKSKSQ